MNMNATAQMVTTTQVGCERKTIENLRTEAKQDWKLIRELESKVQILADALHFYRNHDDNGQTATDALRKIGK